MSACEKQLQNPFESVADIRRGLESLNASTQRVLHHVKIFEEQKQFLRAHREKQISSKLEDSISKQEILQAQHLKLLNEELAQNIDAKLQTQRERIDHALNDAVLTSNAKLNADDRRLDKFDNLMCQDTPSSVSELSRQDHRNTQLLEALRVTNCEKFKLNLNRTYLQTLQDGLQYSKKRRADDSKIQDVQDDLSTLFSEIEGVVELLVSHDHGQKLNDISELLAHLEQENRAHEIRHILHQLVLLTDELSLLAERNEMLQSHRIASARFGKIQQNTMPLHRRMPSETSRTTSNHLKLESLRRQLDSSSTTSLLDMRKSIDQTHNQLRCSIESTRNGSTRHHQMMLNSSGSNLEVSSLMLADFDTAMAASKARIDDPGLEELGNQTMFKDAWVNTQSRT